MIVNLNSLQMLQVWRKAAGLEPSFTDCSLEVFDGVDINDMLRTKMRCWYLDLLDTAPPRLIGPPADALSLVSLQRDGRDFRARLALDPSVRRLVSVRLSGWARSATVVDAADIPGLIALQDNPYCAAGSIAPLAWRDSSGCCHLAPVSPDDVVDRAEAYIDPGDDSYILDELALTDIKVNLDNYE